jgi:hypothetical protein
MAVMCSNTPGELWHRDGHLKKLRVVRVNTVSKIKIGVCVSCYALPTAGIIVCEGWYLVGVCFRTYLLF